MRVEPHTTADGANMANREKEQARFIGVDKAEQIYGLSRWTFRRWAYDGTISSVKLGRRLLVPVEEIERVVVKGTRPAIKPQR